MGGKRAVHYYEMTELEVPLSCNKPKLAKPGAKRASTNRHGAEKTTTTVYKNELPGGLTVQVSKRHKVKEFVDNNNGRLSSKEEVTYKSSFKVDNAVQGIFNEVQTQVKFKKAPSSSNNSTKPTNKHIMFDF